MVMRFSCVAMMLRKHLLRGDQIQDRAGQRGVRHQARQRAFELAHIGFDGAGDVLGNIVGNWTRSDSAFFCRMAILVSRSGG